MDINLAVKEIREIIKLVQEDFGLKFYEEDHKYEMRDTEGIIRDDFPSVSKVLKNFYIPFDNIVKATEMTNGDLVKRNELLEKWAYDGTYSTNMGSRVHYELEKEVIALFGAYKDVRKPIFECDEEQLVRSGEMIVAGKRYIDLMISRGAVLLDTEVVLGSPRLKYTGQPDKFWLIPNKTKTEFGLVISDWKTNKPKNFLVQPYTKKMLAPFENLDDTALSHYFIQLPLYVKLFLDMLKGTKYEKIKFYGGIVVHLQNNKSFTEYRVPSDIYNLILNENFNQYL